MYPGRLNEFIESEERRLLAARYTEVSEPTFTPVFISGGIGDTILAIPALQRLKEYGCAPIVYSKHSQVLKCFYDGVPIHHGDMPAFTWHLDLNSVAKFKATNKFKGFLLPADESLFDMQQKLFKADPDLELLVQGHPKRKYLLTRVIEANCTMSAIYSLGFPTYRLPAPARKKPPEDYITIHDGYDASYTVSGRATKQWKWESWNMLVRQLKAAYPGTEIIQVGSARSRIIDGVTKNLVNQTTITEAFDIIAGSRLHIDTDSGLVHAATALGVPCVVMFGPTPKEFYGHPQNINVSRETSCLGGCFHLTRNWMDKCPIGYQSPQCMDDIGPSLVMSAVVGVLK